MTREELLHELMKSAEISRADAANFYQALLDVAMGQLKNVGEFTFPGFGSLKVTVRKAREGRNPSTGEKLMIPSRKGLKFKPYKDLAATLNSPEGACCTDTPVCEGDA
ncbi:MAG: HU family DNA-binding protein [Planctomycetes bacterium]|nr:HU family DNA-binding protein [Planctomycetota bacterium]